MTKEAFVKYGLGDYSKAALEIIFKNLDDSFKDDYSDDELSSAFACIKDCYTETNNPDEIEEYKEEGGTYWDLTDEKGKPSTLFEHIA